MSARPTVGKLEHHSVRVPGQPELLIQCVPGHTHSKFQTISGYHTQTLSQKEETNRRHLKQPLSKPFYYH